MPSNNALFDRAGRMKEVPETVASSMPKWFRENGYTTVAVGKVSHHPGGWGGEDWDDKTNIEMPGSWDRQLMPSGAWKNPRGAMHGLANGEVRAGRSFSENKMDGLQSFDGPDTSYNDGLIAVEGMQQLTELAGKEKPFFLAVGLDQTTPAVWFAKEIHGSL